MYSHCVSCAEEYTDWEAREATYRKAREMLGIVHVMVSLFQMKMNIWTYIQIG